MTDRFPAATPLGAETVPPEPHTRPLRAGGHTLAINALLTGRGVGPGAWTIEVDLMASEVTGLAPDDLRRRAMAALRTAYPGRTGTATIAWPREEA